ncbi:PREDICTED: uncharacterized protein LOC105365459 [Ceratosolen solmsi marchali]|uniref:Protein amnionless n=1 Tax=Ceratosolen solmsi marchali TaxID=326594 RepID=A0AAJ7DZA3_9HYME|nr:PREDICTED: uncharacterized protein LOC105365459 [Ceratosolen solmsi marchali]
MKSRSQGSIIALILATVCLEVLPSLGLEKYWMADVDWSSPGNWLDGLLPETDTRVIFPVEARHAVGLPGNADLRLAGIELPRDGIVALTENGKLTVSEKTKLLSRESHWLRETPFFWLDPLNWNASSEAAPHLERLPCQGDIVVLPANSRIFSIRLPTTRDVEVAGVRLADDNETIAEWEWSSMAERSEFVGPRLSVKYNSLLECENCQCQEGDLSAYAEEICSIQRARCGPPTCEYPLKVEGHCCYYCGGRIRLSRKTLLTTIQRVVKKALKGYEDTLFWHSRLTWDGNNEILITEKGAYEGTNVIIATTHVESSLKEEEVEVLYSETSGGPLYDYRLAVALGPFLGGLLVLLVLLLLLCPLFGYSCTQILEACQEVAATIFMDKRVNDRNKKSFAFARFENVSEGAIQLAEEEETHPQSITAERFENPLYRSKEKLKSQNTQEKIINPEEPISLIELQKAVAEPSKTDEIEMDIENL